MASEESESSSARDDAVVEEASAAAARQQQRAWVALSSLPVVYGVLDAAAEELLLGAADLLLEFGDPPASYLALPERLVPDARRHKHDERFPRIVAAAPARLLVTAAQGRQRFYLFLDVRARTALRLPAVPRELATMLDPRRAMGLAADPRFPGQGQYLLAQLLPAQGAAPRALLCFSTATGEWTLKQLASAPNHGEPWGAHDVFALGGFLWWIDAYGLLFCDPFEENPRLRLVTLPDGCQMQGLGNGPRDTRVMDQRRLARPSQGMLRYVEIQGLSYDPAAVSNNVSVAMWTLFEPEGADPWRPEHETSFTDIWAHPAYIAAGLPQGKVPALALIDPNDHKVIYFFQGTMLFAWDAGVRRVFSSNPFWVDRAFHDLGFQCSGFVQAWESELPPTVQGDDPDGKTIGQLKGLKRNLVYIEGPNPLSHKWEHQPQHDEENSSPREQKKGVQDGLKNVKQKIKEETKRGALKKLSREETFLKGTLAVLALDDDEED